jgi:hypothetical protein
VEEDAYMWRRVLTCGEGCLNVEEDAHTWSMLKKIRHTKTKTQHTHTHTVSVMCLQIHGDHREDVISNTLATH